MQTILLQTKDGEYLTFLLGEKGYCLNTAESGDLINSSTIPVNPLDVGAEDDEIPGRPDRPIPIVDLRDRTGPRRRSYDGETCIVFVKTGAGLVGMAMDVVTEDAGMKQEKREPDLRVFPHATRIIDANLEVDMHWIVGAGTISCGPDVKGTTA